MAAFDDLSPVASGWEVMTQLRRTQHRIEVAMDQSLEAFGISYAQYRALEVVLAANEPHISEIARRLRVTRQAARESVLKLERSGLVETTRETRQTYVRPTAKARRFIDRIRSFGDVARQLDDALDPTDRGRLVGLLREVDGATRPPRKPVWWLETS